MSDGPEYGLLPAYMRPGMQLYVDRGVLPGDFLQAVLRNDFASAVLRADGTNLLILRQYAVFLHSLPPNSWGSQENVEAWADHQGRLYRLQEERA